MYTYHLVTKTFFTLRQFIDKVNITTSCNYYLSAYLYMNTIGLLEHDQTTQPISVQYFDALGSILNCFKLCFLKVAAL